jgi:hypothetical protein
MAAVRELPQRVERPWGEGAMARQADDGRGRAWKKAMARALGTAGTGDTLRPVPERAVVQRHLQDVLLPAVDDETLQAALLWAQWSQSLERVWIGWAGSTLRLLVRSRRADGEEVASVWGGVRDAAEALHVGLQELLDDPPRTGPGNAYERCRRKLEGDLAVAGSFVYDPREPGSDDWQLPRVERARPPLETLDSGVAARLSLYSTVLGVVAAASAVRTRLLSRFEKECLAPIRDLRGVADELEALRARVPAEADARTLASALRQLREAVSEAGRPVLDGLPEPELAEEIVEGGGRAIGEALGALVNQMPETIVLTPSDVAVHAKMRKVDTRVVPLQQLARQAFDVLRVERIASAPQELSASVERLTANVEELERVFRFAFDSALEELEPRRAEAVEGGEAPEVESVEGAADPLEHAPRLVLDALQNIADSLRAEVDEVELAFSVTGDRLAEELAEGTLGLIDRVAAGGVQAQMLAARSGLVALRAWATERWGAHFIRLGRRVHYLALRARRLWRRGSRAGRRVLSGSSAEEVASARLVRLLADAAAMMRTLPPVYQRLFTLEPVAEPSLLVGREAVLADAVARWRRLDDGEADCIVYRALPGSGLTSFLHALEKLVEKEGGRVARIAPAARLPDEKAWAATLADALGLPAARSLDDVAAAILDSEPGTIPGLVTLDNLDHLFLRAPGGAELIDGTLTLMAQTEGRVCWVGGITHSAWQQVEAAVPMAAAQIDSVRLERLAPKQIRAAITARHRRSGLPLRYKEPRGRRLLQRKLRRASSPEEKRSLLADDFFDQLERACAGDLRLALFQWLQCCDFDQEDGLVIRPPVRPDYSALDSLSLGEAFTLKAFLDHRTLDLSEHDAIFRLERDESAQMFEALVNRRLIRPVGAGPVDTSPSSRMRFRIHGLLIGAVSQHLRGRNIVH